MLGWVFKPTAPSPSPVPTLKWEPIRYTKDDLLLFNSKKEYDFWMDHSAWFIPHPTYSPDDVNETYYDRVVY